MVTHFQVLHYRLLTCCPVFSCPVFFIISVCVTISKNYPLKFSEFYRNLLHTYYMIVSIYQITKSYLIISKLDIVIVVSMIQLPHQNTYDITVCCSR